MKTGGQLSRSTKMALSTVRHPHLLTMDICTHTHTGCKGRMCERRRRDLCLTGRLPHCALARVLYAVPGDQGQIPYAEHDVRLSSADKLLGVPGLQGHSVTHSGGVCVLWHDDVIHRKSRSGKRLFLRHFIPS